MSSSWRTKNSGKEETKPNISIDVKVNPGDPRNPAANIITTTKYTWYSWLPKSMWEQFRRIANVYFLFISILMLIGTYATYLFISPLDPFSTVMTLLFVLLVTSFKEGSEDLQRARSDDYENNKEVILITFDDRGEMQERIVKSKDVNPGDIVKLNGHCAVPVDLLLIFTSLHADGNKCYIETANIDGETNLKVKEAPPLLLDSFGKQILAGKVGPEMFKGSIECQSANKHMHKFEGTLTLSSAKEQIPLSADNLILRSSVFSNTEWGYGIAIYTGQETKIQMNNRQAPSKMSRLEENLNKAIIMIFVAQVILVTVSVISIYILGFNDFDKLPYVFPPGTGDSSILPLWLEQWFVFFLLYNNFIPISLYVTIELVNLGQAFLIKSDENIYQKDLDVACSVRASNLVQELGMVSNIFSDKTGTLTRNEMKLVKFVLNGTLYDIQDSKDKATNHVLNSFGSNSKIFSEFCRALVTCHTVVREKSGQYRAESPDELALVEGVGNYRCNLMERGSKEMIVEQFGDRRTYEVLAVNPFNSDRKRMSILLKDATDNRYFVMCKGADNIMMPLCKLSSDEKSSINKSLLDLANLGLRTLIIAQKQLTAEEASKWLAKFKAATVSTSNRDENIAAAGAELEQNMQLLGITAIEDRLQDEVPEVIADLARANIILWMLTGDKLETAISIGRSCNLILTDTNLVYLTNINSNAEYAQRLNDVYREIETENNKNTALVMDGPSFQHFDEVDPAQRAMLLKIGQSCRSVIACRLTPTQKREVVRLVKKDTVPQATTLAIGDGANDVSMILEGNVGVGIFGKEGRQAANNADFAIGEFKFLRRLLLVHGRWNYVRQSTVFLYCMHKNMVLTLTLFWFSYYTAVSGTSLYESWVYTGFNFILGLPIIFFGFLDRDLGANFMLKYPQTYSTGQSNLLLNIYSIGSWILNAILYAIVICLTFYIAVAPTFIDSSLYVTGTTVFVALCMALQCKVAFFHHQWSYPHVIVMFISVLGMFVYFLVIATAQSDYYMVANVTYEQGIFWFFGFFSVPLFVVLIDVITYYLKYFFFPTLEMQYHEMEHRSLYNDPVESMACRRRGDSVDSNASNPHEHILQRADSRVKSNSSAPREFEMRDAKAML